MKQMRNGMWLLAVVCLGMTACKKDDDTGAGITARVKIVNAAESSSAQDFYLDDTKVNSAAVAYGESSGYISTPAGSNRHAQFRTSGSAAVYASANADLVSDRNYSFYLAGEGESTTIVTTEDDLSAPSSGKAKVRFIHLSTAAASSVDIRLLGGAQLVAGLGFRSSTTFQEMDPGVKVFHVFAAGESTGAIDLEIAALEAGKIYTVWISGATTSNIRARLITNQ